MAIDGKRQRHDAVQPAATRCQLLWAALFLIGTSVVGWFLVLRFLL